MKLLLVICLLAVFPVRSDVFEQWDSLWPNISLETIAWSGNTGLASYERRDDKGEIEAAGWYLVELDDDGRVDWLRYTQQASSSKYAMEAGQVADMASTLAATSLGFAELNPLGVPGVAIVKLLVINAVKNMDASDCYEHIGALTGAGWGAAVFNVASVVGLGPAAIVPGAIALFASVPDENDKFWACAP